MGQNNGPKKIVFEGEEFELPNQSTQIQAPKIIVQTPKIIRWVIKYSGGLIKDEKQANYVFIGFFALAIVISLFLVFGGMNNNRSQWSNPDPAKRFNIDTQSN